MKIMTWIAIALLGLLAAGSLNPLLAVSEQRQAYDKMVEEATKEADEYLQEKENAKKATEAEAQSEQDSALSEKIEAERTRIEAQMDAIRNRGMGGGFTKHRFDCIDKGSDRCQATYCP